MELGEGLVGTLNPSADVFKTTFLVSREHLDSRKR